MFPKKHIICGFLFSLILFILFPSISILGALIIFLSSIAIDIDHYIYFILLKKSISLKKAYDWFVIDRKFWLELSPQKREKFRKKILFLHGVEFLILLGVLAFLSSFFLYIFIGVLFHLILDLIDLYLIGVPLKYKISQTYVLLHNLGKKEYIAGKSK